jgi:translation initiation factor 6
MALNLSKSTNFGNPHIGLFARVSDKLALVDASASPKLINAVGNLGVPAIKITLGASSGLVGIYSCMNSNGVVVPDFCSKEEMVALKGHGLNIVTLPGKYCAAGNNISANDYGAIANPELSASVTKEISDALGVEVVRGRVAGYTTCGSAVIATNKGFAAHNRASEQELKEISSILRVPGQNCTLNTGVPFVSICAIANSRGAVIGEASTGFEAGRLVSALSLD